MTFKREVWRRKCCLFSSAQYTLALQDRYMSAKLELLHFYWQSSYFLFICHQRATAVTGARFAELITINYLPLRWQHPTYKKNICTKKHNLYHVLSSVFFLYDTRDPPVIIKYLSFFFFNKIFNNEFISL